MKIPPKRQGLGNAYGSRVQTTDPVPACKPDLRRYRTYSSPIADDASPEDRRAAWVKMKTTAPEDRRWQLRDRQGVVELVDGVKTATLLCLREKCKSGGKCSHGRKCRGWFSVQRMAGPDSDASWPWYCSKDCAAIAKGVADRKSAKRVRAGTAKTRPTITYVYDSFDPGADDAWQRAYDIVIATPRSMAHNEEWAPDDVWVAAREYIDEWQAEVKDAKRARRRARRLGESIPTNLYPDLQ